MDYADAKTLLSELSGLSKDALHVHAALLLYLIAGLLWRRGFASPRPWLTVAAVTIVNEGYDLWHQEAHGEPARWYESVRDLLNTLVWPTLFLIGARAGLFARAKRRSR